jgi:hypothetical protein
MASGQIVLVKILPYLKEYFIHRFGSEPIKATRDTKIFIILAPYLIRIPSKWRPPVSCDDGLLIELPYSHLINIQKYCYIDPRSYARINKKIYNLFCADLVMYVNHNVFEHNCEIQKAINDFIDLNEMNWDKTNFDTLKKIYYRYRFPESTTPCSKLLHASKSSFRLNINESIKP